jgi:hypothetical protein
MFSANSSQVSGDKLFVEDVFSTYLYAGNGTIQTITNGIDLDGKNGMVWIKNRNASSDPLHYLNFKDGSVISSNNSNNTNSKQVMTPYAAFNSNGFTVNALPGFLNNSGVNYASWTFRKAPKFFDVVTFTGNGVSGRQIAHSLGVAPGCMIIKRTDTSSDWAVYHRGLSAPATNWWIKLNLTDAQTSASAPWADTDPTATTFTVSANAAVNASGGTYVAYLYAHDATADGVIQCGSFTTDGSGNATVNLGWEPQWLLVKRSSDGGDWLLLDSMRGLDVTDNLRLIPNSSAAESAWGSAQFAPSATGFSVNGFSASSNCIYIAIRRGPMRTPTLGTSVFAPITMTGNSSNQTVSTVGFPPDLISSLARVFGLTVTGFADKLRGRELLQPYSTAARTVMSSAANDLISFNQNGVSFGPASDTNYNNNTTPYINWFFRRAPGFFDVVCYTPAAVTGTAVKHNLGVVPELVISKSRTSGTGPWVVAPIVYGNGQKMRLNTADASAIEFNTGYPATSTEIYENAQVGNFPAAPWVAYLFASCPGVSKVGTYTGNGSSQTINCGFAAGARFVLIKRTDSTGDWYVWDTARGIVAGNDPHLSLNTTAAEVTSDDTIDTDSSGFVVNQVAATNVNVNAATYIYLAIA